MRTHHRAKAPGQEGGRQGPPQEQAHKARRAPPRRALPKRLLEPIPRHAVPVPQDEHPPQGRPHQRSRQTRHNHKPNPARPRHRKLAQGTRRHDPATRPHKHPQHPQPPTQTTEPTKQKPTKLRGPRPTQHSLGQTMPERDPRRRKLWPSQEPKPHRQRHHPAQTPRR